MGITPKPRSAPARSPPQPAEPSRACCSSSPSRSLLRAGGVHTGPVPEPARYPQAERGCGISQVAAYRYLAESVEVLAARAPTLRQALDKAMELGLPYLILDGSIVAADRCGEDNQQEGPEIDRWYSGKAHHPRREHPGAVWARRYPAVGVRR